MRSCVGRCEAGGAAHAADRGTPCSYGIMGERVDDELTLSIDSSVDCVVRIALSYDADWRHSSGVGRLRRVRGTPSAGAPSDRLKKSEIISPLQRKLRHLHEGETFIRFGHFRL